MSEKRGRREASSKSSSRSKKPKMKLMDESDQTKAERRQLRLDQRNLRAEVIEQEENIANPMKDTMRDLTEANHKLFKKTRFPREAVQDGDTMRIIAEAAAKQVKKISSGSTGVDLDDFLEKIGAVFSDDGGLNWAKYGNNVATVFLSAPQGGGFMLGPLDKPAKAPRAKSKRAPKITDDDAEGVVPDIVTGKGKKGSKQNKDQTQMRISNMKAHVEKTGHQGQKMPLLETLVNPNSFTQTVENMFDFSFLVKNGQGCISIDKDSNLPEVSFNDVQASAEGNDTPRESKQWLMSFTPADIRELSELYKLEQSYFKHRDEGPKSDYFDPLVHGDRNTSR